MSAAFDTIEHSVLLERLRNSFGVGGIAITWIKSYLTDRTQFVRFQSACSLSTACTCGVPQGSVLGPLLFVAYTAPMANIASQYGVSYHQYADDTQVYVAVSKSSISTTIDNLQNCMSAVHLWLTQNGLVINPDKSEAVLFSTVQSNAASQFPLTSIDVAGSAVPLTDSLKLLGVMLDRHLTFGQHVQNVCRTSQYHIRALRHIRSSLTADMARTVACALVNSRLDYANAVLYKTSRANITKLQRVQNSLARVIMNNKRTDHMHPVLEQLHWLPVSYRIDYKVATLAFKVRSTGSPVYLRNIINYYEPTRELRSSNQLLLSRPSTTTEIARRAFSQAATTVWNELPLNIRSAETFGHFRTLLRTHYYRLAFLQ